MSDNFNKSLANLQIQCQFLIELVDERERWSICQGQWRERLKEYALDVIGAAKKFIEIKNREDG